MTSTDRPVDGTLQLGAGRRVLVTGGSGKLGRAVARELLAHGYGVVNADRQPPPPEAVPLGADYADRVIDVRDVGQVAGALAGCAALIHLAAIPAPGRHPDEIVFATNTQSTFAVLQAAALLGVRRATIASSLSTLGTAWAPVPVAPRYAPVDEAHPLLVQDPYGLSKEVDERTAEMFHRRTGMAIVALRFAWIATAGEARAMAMRLRADPLSDGWWRALWAYVDDRDAAAACRLGIEAAGVGFAVLNITAADTLSETPTEELIGAYAPGVELRAPIPGTASAFSIDRARQVLGWEPRHSWRRPE